ncbi:MAG: HigA family addiction module antidote protein [Rickettsiales bacterium]|jgi:addiction module HigA family antidote|nr:HigA family addiction module antidote protein [Rickettsiales bacterium]
MAKVANIRGIGDYLRTKWLEPFGLSYNELAKAIGVQPNRINDIANGNRGITMDTDLRLCKYFGIADGSFLRVQEQIERAAVKQALANKLNKITSIKKSKN